MKELLHQVCSSLLHRRYTRAQLLLFLCMWLSGGTMLAEDVAPSKADTIMQDGFIFAYTADGDATLLGPTDKELVTYNIPSAINGHAVKVIGEGAFAQCSKMAKLTIPASITRIENTSFNGCTSLSNLVFADGNSSLYLGYKHFNRGGYGEGLFRDCPLEKLYLGRYVYYQ